MRRWSEVVGQAQARPRRRRQLFYRSDLRLFAISLAAALVLGALMWLIVSGPLHPFVGILLPIAVAVVWIGGAMVAGVLPVPWRRGEIGTGGLGPAQAAPEGTPDRLCPDRQTADFAGVVDRVLAAILADYAENYEFSGETDSAHQAAVEAALKLILLTGETGEGVDEILAEARQVRDQSRLRSSP